ncbi:Lrp/AsnC family transcriptional regulator [Candidatus Woesearchaeota archaeon]|nr:Lrp/AsnC family transcriptional regulator [Candidatus Woesearchaeota archaeon]
MDKQNINIPRLTKNEQKVLKKIIDQAKIPDLEIAKKMGLSQQGIFKIRHKLEEVGIIKGYMPIIDFKKIGVKSLVVLGIRLTSYIWGKYPEDQISERIQKIPQVITAYRIPESNISHLLVMGFKDIEHKDRYLMKLQSKYSGEIEVVTVYPFSVDRIIKTNPIGLLSSIINQKTNENEFFIDK